MPHEYEGKYSTKHPAGAKPDPLIAAALDEVLDDGRVSCAVAHDISEELEVAPAEVGRTLDLLEHRISKCQMGLFGYATAKKIVKPAEAVADELRDRLESSAVEGKLSCAVCWAIAAETGLHKMAVAAACEALGFKVAACQLGAF